MFQQHFIELTMLRSASLTCLDVCCCHGLRLPVFNKETTYLRTYPRSLRMGYSKQARTWSVIGYHVSYSDAHRGLS